MRKLYFCLAFMTVISFNSFGKVRLTESDAHFDLRTFKVTRGMLKPNITRLGNELAILINNLYKRRELDEVNVRSLVRIRVYLAILYKQTNQKKLQARMEMAIRQITEELKHRFDFENRYNSGLVKGSAPKKSMETQTEGMGFSSLETERVPGQSPSFASVARQIQSTPRFGSSPLRTPVSAVSNPSFSNISLSESVSATRGRRLAALIEKGYIKESQLTPDDARLLKSYRSNKTVVPSRGFSGSRSVRSIPSQSQTARSDSVQPVQREISVKSLSQIPDPPPMPTFPKAPYRRSSSAERQPISSSSQNDLITDPALNSVGDEIEKRRSAWQGLRDQSDFRDQIQGASDAEWEAS